MDTHTPPDKQYKQVTVDVPEDRLAEFHAFFGRFLAGGMAPRRPGRHGKPHRNRHGRHCARPTETSEASEASAPTTEV